MMNRLSYLLVAAAAAALPLPAQRVVPAANTTKFGNWREVIFGESQPRVQQIIDGGLFCKTSARITGLSLRRDEGKYGSSIQAGQRLKTLQVRMGYAAVRPEKMSLTYSSNIVPNSMTTVISGQYNFPTLYPNDGPGVWQIQWPMSQPFNYVRPVGGLLLDIQHNDVFPSYRYELDAVDVTSGFTRFLPSGTCGTLPGTNTCLATMVNRKRSYPKIGDQLDVEVFRMPSPASAFTIFGLSSTKWGSTSLPFDLSSIGASRFNTLQVSMDLVLPMKTFQAGGSDPWAGLYAASVSVPIPNQQALVGFEFYAQSYAQLGAPALPVTAALGWHVRIGEDKAPLNMIWGLGGGLTAMGFFGGGGRGGGPVRHGGLVTRLSGTFQ